MLAGAKSQGNKESDKTREVRHSAGPTALKKEQEDEVYILNKNSSIQFDEHSFFQSSKNAERAPFLQPITQSTKVMQNRPSVLRSTTLPHHVGHPSFTQLLPKMCETAVKYTGKDNEYSTCLSSVNEFKPPSVYQNSIIQSELISFLFVNGQCCWPDCDEAFEEFSLFLKHLSNEHSCGEKTIAQWTVQQERIRHMENQLVQEKQKLQAMQLHLRLTQHTTVEPRVAISCWRPLKPSVPPSEEPDGSVEWAIDSAGCQKYLPMSAPHLLADFVTSVECYKHVNIRPPYTYAFLIRWCILDAPGKQRPLNEIYNWFIQMFYYFRHNTPTWKNAVRHNLSLHKCFVRVDGEKGAVWTVDEKEFQKRKSQRFNRDSFKWLAPSSYPFQHHKFS